MSELSYPVRCVIVDVDGEELIPGSGWVMRTPEASKPHIGKHGTARKVYDPDMPDNYRIRVVLDDGTELDGGEC